MIALNKRLDIMPSHTIASYTGFINSDGILGRRKRKETIFDSTLGRRKKKESFFSNPSFDILAATYFPYRE